MIQTTGSSLAYDVCLLLAYNRYRLVAGVDTCVVVAALVHFFSLSSQLWMTVAGRCLQTALAAADRALNDRCWELCKRLLLAWGWLQNSGCVLAMHLLRRANVCKVWFINSAEEFTFKGVGTNFGVGVGEARPEGPRAGVGVLGEEDSQPLPTRYRVYGSAESSRSPGRRGVFLYSVPSDCFFQHLSTCCIQFA